MRRYWVPQEALQREKGVVLKGPLFHHICVVCRQAVGSRFEVICEGQAYLVEIQSMGKNQAMASVLEKRSLPKPTKPEVHLALSLPRFQTLDKVVEKMVELGVGQVHLFTSEFSFMKVKAGELSNKQERWEKIIQGATEQTGRGDLMPLKGPHPLGTLLQENFPQPGRQGLLAYEGEGGETLKTRLHGLGASWDEVWVFVGSEGGFSRKDLELFRSYGILPVSLGDQVLRVETACVTLVSILKYALG